MNRIAKFFRDYSFARFVLPLGLVLIIFGCIMYGPVLARQSYPQTVAVVSRTELFEEAYSENGTHHEATYRIFVKYTVGGTEYEEEYGVLPEMKVGTALKINYNAADPHDIGQPNSILLPIGMVVSGIVLLAVGVISIIKTRQKNKALKLQEEEWKHGS